jgi:NAD(P)-dependent dehydrogenase (short-subunit alcohol dehydrogenase family)
VHVIFPRRSRIWLRDVGHVESGTAPRSLGRDGPVSQWVFQGMAQGVAILRVWCCSLRMTSSSDLPDARADISCYSASTDLSGKVALVTGATRGLGREIALGLAACGADLVVVSRHQEACDEAAASIRSLTGREVMAKACHVGDWAAIDELVDASYKRFGHVDVLINNAGMSPTFTSLSAVTETLFDKTLGVNLKGPFRLIATVGERMAAADGGSVISISSSASAHPRPEYVPYAAAKAGLNAITVGFSRAYGPKVRVNAVMAGPFKTDVTANWDLSSSGRFAHLALGRIGMPREIVGAVLYFAGSASSFTTGAILAVNGGEP